MIVRIKKILKELITQNFAIEVKDIDNQTVRLAGDIIVRNQMRLLFGNQCYCDEDYTTIDQLAFSFFVCWTQYLEMYQDNINKMYQALIMTYNPINNYDRTGETVTNYEKGTETEATNYDTTVTKTDGTYITSTEISAYDSALKDESQVSKGHAAGAADTDAKTGTDTTTRSYDDDTTTVTEHVSGNIGVTTSQQMLVSELQLRQFNLVTEIITKFVRMYCFTGWECDD